MRFDIKPLAALMYFMFLLSKSPAFKILLILLILSKNFYASASACFAMSA